MICAWIRKDHAHFMTTSHPGEVGRPVRVSSDVLSRHPCGIYHVSDHSWNIDKLAPGMGFWPFDEQMRYVS